MARLKSFRKYPAILLALALALSSLGGAPVMAWLHADGSLCELCPAALEQNSSPICCPQTTQPTSDDCRVCCTPQESAETPQQLWPAFRAAILPQQSATVKYVQIKSGVLSAPLQSPHRFINFSLPSLRAPPHRVDFA